MARNGGDFTTEEMRAQVREYLQRTFTHGRTVSDEEPLFENGHLDSLGFLQLLAFLEQRFAVRFTVSDIGMDKFGTVTRIVRRIAERKSASHG